MIDDKAFCVRLIDGKLYNPFYPTGPVPSPETIAYGLSNLNRYGGHATRPYSVCEHSIWVCLYLACKGETDGPIFRSGAALLRVGDSSAWTDIFVLSPTRLKLALFGLIHDAPEATGLVDVPGPVLRNPEMSLYKEAHKRSIQWLCEGWKIQPPPWPDEVKAADVAVLGAERAIRPKGDDIGGSGEDIPSWPGLDLAEMHDLSKLGTDKIRDVWITAYYVLRKWVS